MAWNVQFCVFLNTFLDAFGRRLGRLEAIKACIFNRHQIMNLNPFWIIVTLSCGSHFGKNLGQILEPFWYHRGINFALILDKIPSKTIDVRFGYILVSFLAYQNGSKINPKVGSRIDLKIVPKMMRTNICFSMFFKVRPLSVSSGGFITPLPDLPSGILYI